jgi:hypothetical protein
MVEYSPSLRQLMPEADESVLGYSYAQSKISSNGPALAGTFKWSSMLRVEPCKSRENSCPQNYLLSTQILGNAVNGKILAGGTDFFLPLSDTQVADFSLFFSGVNAPQKPESIYIGVKIKKSDISALANNRHSGLVALDVFGLMIDPDAPLFFATAEDYIGSVDLFSMNSFDANQNDSRPFVWKYFGLKDAPARTELRRAVARNKNKPLEFHIIIKPVFRPGIDVSLYQELLTVLEIGVASRPHSYVPTSH